MLNIQNKQAIEYYKNQLARIDLKDSYYTEYKPTILISGKLNQKTNYLNLNKKSAKVLIKWLENNFIKKEVK